MYMYDYCVHVLHALCVWVGGGYLDKEYKRHLCVCVHQLPGLPSLPLCRLAKTPASTLSLLILGCT